MSDERNTRLALIIVELGGSPDGQRMLREAIERHGIGILTPMLRLGLGLTKSGAMIYRDDPVVDVKSTQTANSIIEIDFKSRKRKF